ncbi:MAG TPA: hypothetical protein VHB99_09910, partial [Pirellulales bacterium]|nr:hypothetical protein [Pirellulales bacterium]
LDRFYAVQPGPPKGAKRLVVLAPLEQRACIEPEWIADIADYGTIVWQGRAGELEELDAHEYVSQLA